MGNCTTGGGGVCVWGSCAAGGAHRLSGHTAGKYCPLMDKMTRWCRDNDQCVCVVILKHVLALFFIHLFLFFFLETHFVSHCVLRLWETQQHVQTKQEVEKGLYPRKKGGTDLQMGF